jgi:hypothetical protein
VEFEMNNYTMWKAITMDGDIEVVRSEISKEGFAEGILFVAT